jgi:hypothetical protein
MLDKTVAAPAMTEADREAAIRYDRQVRLWGSTTQQMLQATQLLVGPGAAGSEVVKNLALGGVGHITLHDPATVCEADVQSCCLLRPGDVGAARRDTAVAQRLAELNPLVQVSVLDSYQQFNATLRERNTDALRFVLFGNRCAPSLTSELAHATSASNTFFVNVFSPTCSESLVAIVRSAEEVAVLDGRDEKRSVGFWTRRPVATQRALLQWQLSAVSVPTDYAERLQITLDARDAAGAHAVTDSMLETEVLAERWAGATADVLHNSVVGGIICQQIIGRISQAAAEKQAAATQAPQVGTLFQWAHVTPGQCLVGGLED